MKKVRIGTRGSALALAQAGLVADALAAHGIEHELVIVQTEGDRRAPDTAWGEGAFVAAIERALLDRRADVAVHSAKDVPTDETLGLAIAAYLPRADPRDALVVAAGASSRSLETLPAGTVIGTDSPRRTGFLRARRPDVRVMPLHGNVDTRLRRLDTGEVGALVLAVAGLVRLGRDDRIDERLDPLTLPPAPGQGAICVQVRADDHALIDLARLIDDVPTRLAVEAERAFLRAAGGGCRAPIGALAETDDGNARLRLLGGFATVDGRSAVVDAMAGRLVDGESMARDLAARLGSRRLARAGTPRVLVTRPASDSRPLVERLAEHGIEALVVPAIAIEAAPVGGALDRALTDLDAYAWAIVTSVNGARAVVSAGQRLGIDVTRVRWACVGEATARALHPAGVVETWRPSVPTAAAIGGELPVGATETVLLLRGSLADTDLRRLLEQRGATVSEVVAYRTHEAPPASRPLLAQELAAGAPDAIVFASPSAVRGLLALGGPAQRDGLRSVPAICIGPTTAAAAREAGFALVGQSAGPYAAAVAEAVADLLASRATGAPA